MTNEIIEDSFKQHVNGTMTVFAIAMPIFVLIKTFLLYTSVDETERAHHLKIIFTFLTLAIYFLFSYFTILSATGEEIICGEYKYKIAFYATIIPFIFIYSFGIFLISIFPGWVRCFSNTFGSSILSLGLQSTIINKLNETQDTSSVPSSRIRQLYSNDPKILLNEIEFDRSGNLTSNVINAYKELGITIKNENDNENDNDEIKNLFKQYIYCKDSIGEGIWHFLLGIISILSSYNIILAENCNTFTVTKDKFKKKLNEKFQKN